MTLLGHLVQTSCLLCRDPIDRVHDASDEMTNATGDQSADAINRVPTEDGEPGRSGWSISFLLEGVISLVQTFFPSESFSVATAD